MKRSVVLVMVVFLCTSMPFAHLEVAAQVEELKPYLVELEGLQAAVFRQFESTQVPGLRVLTVEIASFDTGRHAGDAIPTIRERAFANYAQGEDITKVKETSSRTIGDRTYVYSGLVHAYDSPQTYTIAPTFVRSGSLLYIVQATAIIGDPVSDSIDTVFKVLSRTEGPVVPLTTTSEMQSGGLWDLLPTLANIPEGLTHFADVSPKPFEPLVGQQ